YDFRWRQRSAWSRALALSDAALAEHASLEHFRSAAPPRSLLRNAGWHLSYFMPRAEIVRKLESFSHAEQNRDELKHAEHIAHCLRTGADLFGNASMRRSDSTDLPDGWRELQAWLEAQH
ncbi:MAG TPA: hypothetical protein VHM19_05480, partial [Polyangiales bacterium]|nr:hypothetical protein [Polyangiales bacterium]